MKEAEIEAKSIEIEAKWAALQPRERDAWIAETVAKEIKWVVIPSFSTDMSAAWIVVEQMRRRNDFFFIECPHITPNRFSYAAGFGSYTSENSSAPEAICLAALKNVLCTDEKDILWRWQAFFELLQKRLKQVLAEV